MQHTSGESEALLDQIQTRLADERDLIANAATTTALLFEGMEAVDWVGLYFIRDGEFVLGPFQGRAARTRLPFSHPTAGRAVREGRSIIVDDMTQLAFDDDDFPARSQIVVPVTLHGKIVALLQVDSPFMNRFKMEDQNMLERAAGLLFAASDTSAILPRRSTMNTKRKPARGAQHRPGSRTILDTGDGSMKTYSFNRSTFADSAHSRPAKVTKRVWARRIAAVVIAGIFFGVALSNSIYEITSPAAFEYHVLLRKVYSIVAFAVVGFCFSLGWRWSVRRTVVNLAFYSAIIEIGQFFVGSREGLGWNIVDVACGAIGGYLGAAVLRAMRKNRQRSPETAV